MIDNDIYIGMERGQFDVIKHGSHMQLPTRIATHKEIKTINDMIVDDRNHYVLAGYNGIIHVRKQHATQHLKG
jgi:hypothetical protein